MARTVDPKLTEDILGAAFRLFRARGDKGLTLRAVARAAGTTTPSVYQRFPARQDLVDALGQRARQHLAQTVMKAHTLEAAFRTYLEVAQDQPHLYQLVFGPNLQRILGADDRRPMLEWLQEQFRRRIGGTKKEQETHAYGAILLLHGAASMLQFAPRGKVADEIRARCLAACEQLLRQHPRGNSSSGRS